MVREYFELHGFLLRQQRKHIPRTAEEDEEIDFFVFNPQAEQRPGSLPFQLEPEDLKHVAHAIVAVKGWHTDVFGAAMLSRETEVFKFADVQLLKSATQFFGNPAIAPLRLLVISGLPRTPALRDQSVALLRQKGVDGVISFRTVLTALIATVEVNRNYQKSDVLQLIRILKNYECFKELQLELFRARRKK